ncbi:MAG: IBR domain-containing protein [Deltaproteobacteria bacterium]|nr:IBR domain-containing protein [Deltaproteobacteria bacterium]
MPEVVPRKCPNCSAALPPLGDAEHVKCDFCGHSFDVKRTVAMPAPAPPSPAPRPWPAGPGFAPIPVARPSVGARIGCAVIFPLVLMIAIGAFVWLQFSGGVSSIVSGTGGAGLVVPRLTWMRTIGFFQVDGDAIEDVAMLVRTTLEGDQIYLVVLDGAAGQEKWRVGPFGSYSQGFQFTHVAAAGNRVLVTDFRAQGHLYDIASGAPVATVALADRAKKICAVESATQAALVLQNGSRVILDLATGATQPLAVVRMGRDECPPVRDLSVPQTDLEAAPAAAVAGLDDARVITLGELRVAVGRRAAGVRVPMAVGLGPDGRTPTWTVVIPTVDETQVEESGSDTLRFGLGSGRLYAAYSLRGNQARIAGVDARTGARLWETAFQGWASSVDIDALRVGPTRVVVEQFGEAEVFDAQTGALLARIAPR